MRIYRITGAGKEKVRSSVQDRDPILDFLYQTKNQRATTDELKAVGGPNADQLIWELKRKGCIEEVSY